MSNGDKKKKRIAMGATLSSRTGPKSKSIDPKSKSSLLIQKKHKKLKINDKNYQPIAIRGQDLENFDTVLNFLRKSGIPVDGYKRAYLIRRTRARIGRLKLDTYLDYLIYLRKNSNEIKELHETLSINVTRFFRNEDTYEIIREEVLPSILEETSKINRIRMWSAGCAVGAEPYSLAMLCNNENFRKYNIQILATDINKELLELAENGVYSPQYLGEMTQKNANKFFYKDLDGNYKIRPSVQKLVRFDLLDLTKDSFPTNLDLILCRNVLIYIDRLMQETIIEKFHQALKIGGILILGRTETLWGEWRSKFSAISSKHRIYKKL